MALKAQLADTRAIERYIKTYREGRKRFARANAGKREALERTLAQAEREVGRLVDGFQRGIISDEEACKPRGPPATGRSKCRPRRGRACHQGGRVTPSRRDTLPRRDGRSCHDAVAPIGRGG